MKRGFDDEEAEYLIAQKCLDKILRDICGRVKVQFYLNMVKIIL